jgi:WD40 repeat protein
MTARERQQAREDRAKDNEYQLPAAVSQIAAESLVRENPLLDPNLAHETQNYKVQSLSSLTLMDLVMLRAAFEEADDDNSGELDDQEFVQAFLPLLSADAGDVGLLFLKIDANCNGTVSWDEFLFYIISQDESALKIAAESSRSLFDYPPYVDSASLVSGHRDTCAGLMLVPHSDRYVSYSRRGDLLAWRPDAIEGAKIANPKEFATNLPLITGMERVREAGRADRICLSSADKQLLFVDIVRDSCKAFGNAKLDFSPLCMCMVEQTDDSTGTTELSFAFGDDTGGIHVLDADRIENIAEEHLKGNRFQHTREAQLQVWSAHGRHSWVTKVAWVEDMRVLLSGGSDGQIVVSDVTKGEVRLDGFQHRGEVHDFLWLRKVQLLASCGLERHINMWQIPIKTPVYQLEGHQASVQQLCSAGQMLISLDTAKVILVWDLREMASIQRLEAFKVHPEHPIGRIVHDSKRDVLVSLSRRIALWHIRKRKVPYGHTTAVTCTVYNPMFELVISADEASGVRVWDLNSGRAVLHFAGAHLNDAGEPMKITAMSLDHTMRRLITGAHNGSLKVWNFSTGVCLKELTGFGSGEVTAITYMYMHPYEYIIATGWNRKVVFWTDSHEAKITRVAPSFDMQGHREDILCMACHHESNKLVTGAYDGDIVVWNTDSEHVSTRLILPGILSMKGENRPIEGMTMLDCGALDGTRPRRPSMYAEQPGHGRVAKGGDNTVLLVTAGGDGVLRFWSTTIMAELLLEHPVQESAAAGLCAIAACTFSRVLVVADSRGFITVFDINALVQSSHRALPPASAPLAMPIECARFSAHRAMISSLQYISGRRLIVTGSHDHAICLWTLMGERMGTFGEDASAWSLSAGMYRFEQELGTPVFGCDLDDGESAAARPGSKGSSTRMERMKTSRRKSGVAVDRGRSARTMSTGLSSIGRTETPERPGTRGAGGEGSADGSTGGGGGGGFFMTDLEGSRPATAALDDSELEPAAGKDEAEWGSSEDDETESEVSEDELEEDATEKQMTAEEAHRTRLRVSCPLPLMPDPSACAPSAPAPLLWTGCYARGAARRTRD